jgi:DNA repair exonuclease SbcCD ATPase subunit
MLCKTIDFPRILAELVYDIENSLLLRSTNLADLLSSATSQITAMTDASSPFTVNSSAGDIETVYTTAAPQGESTDWLTAVRNLRQSNRKLLDQIEAMEAQMAELRNENTTYQERFRSQGLKIVQQDDDLQIARERVGSLFEQLENSHQIGQRQQILVETLSQKLEIAQTIVAEIEGENNQLKQSHGEQEHRLRKTEAVAQELYRRLKQQVSAQSSGDLSGAIPKMQPQSQPESHHDEFDDSPLSGPLEFEVEPIRTAWPAPAVQAAAELKAKPPTTLDLPKFGKRQPQH